MAMGPVMPQKILAAALMTAERRRQVKPAAQTVLIMIAMDSLTAQTRNAAPTRPATAERKNRHVQLIQIAVQTGAVPREFAYNVLYSIAQDLSEAHNLTARRSSSGCPLRHFIHSVGAGLRGGGRTEEACQTAAATGLVH